MPEDYYGLVVAAKVVAWDTETSGLDWRKERLAICQLCTPAASPAVVRLTQYKPARLCALLADAAVKKVFHHAMFDLRFMSRAWGVLPRHVACTKIAAKLLDQTNHCDHTLQGLLKDHLGVFIEKTERFSNWFAALLVPGQLNYAANDVLYLIELLQVLLAKLDAESLPPPSPAVV